MPLQGNLADFSLEEVIQTITQGKKSGKLEVLGRMGVYGIFFENGKIIHAFGPFAIGEDAAMDVFLEDGGSFVFKQNLILPPQTIKKDTMDIMMEGIALRENFKEVAAKVKKEGKIAPLGVNSGLLELKENEWKIVKLALEGKSIREIIEMCNICFFQFVILLKSLEEKGFVKIGG